jgi:hypothetical protein
MAEHVSYGNKPPQEHAVYATKDEQHDVEVWRQEKLEEAGFPRLVAYGIATRPDVDYHRALEMFRQGCPPETAAKILY